MSTQNFRKHLLFISIALIPIVYTIVVWKQLPDEVPTHFNLNGEPNGYTGKSFLWILTAINLFTYFILQKINIIDPKRVNKPINASIDKLSKGVLLFLTALTILIIISALHPEKKLMGLAMLPVVGLLFVFLGNYMYNIKPNYFAGFRLPWTLASDFNWRKTHHLAGRLWFFGGMLITVSGLLFPYNVEKFVFNTLIAILVLVPIAYSFLLFKTRSNNPDYFKEETN